jgi:hypothetical protein
VFDWIRRRFAADRSPMYAAIKQVASRTLPASLTDREGSAEHQAACEASQATWREAPLRPADDDPLVTLIAAPRQQGFVTLTLPEGRCLPLFTSPFRAMDYAAVRLALHANVPVIVSSAADLAAAMPTLIEGGVTSVAIDICPRCSVVLSAGVENLASPDMTIGMWSIALGARDARRALYLSEAEAYLRRGERPAARDIALEVVAHVDAEDPRAHWLIGQIAIAEGDGAEFREARQFLELLGVQGWSTRLDDAWNQRATFGDYPPMPGRS